MGNADESDPLLTNQGEGEKEEEEKEEQSTTEAEPNSVGQEDEQAVSTGWTAEGLPMSVGPVEATIGELITRRATWDSSLWACLGRNDEFCSTDIEVCLLGSVAPCVLYASNAERLESAPGTFTNHCLPYTGLYVFGNSFFGWNCMSPWFSYPSRTAIRRKFNLKGSCEVLTESFECCGSTWEDEVQREQCESVCDLTTHVFCHPCALCQEARELRRRLPHPAFPARPVLIMIPPSEQAMGRDS